MKFALQRIDSTDSTNSWLRRAAGSLADGTAVYTDNQTAGRGRGGKVWENQPGQALYYSVLLRRPLADPAALPLAVSLAASDAVQTLCGRVPGIKWPNDLLLFGKKICGILCESVQGDGEACYIAGIGLNLVQPASFFEQGGLPHGGSIFSLTGVDCTVDVAAQALTNALQKRLDVFAGGGFASIAQQYRTACINLGRRVFTDQIEGIAEQIDDAGRLVVRTASGEVAVFTGEVTVRGIY